MKTKTDTLRGAVVRSALAVALILSMVPAQALIHIDQASATETATSADQAAADRTDRPDIITDSVNIKQNATQSGEGDQASNGEAEAAPEGSGDTGSNPDAANTSASNDAAANANANAAAAGTDGSAVSDGSNAQQATLPIVPGASDVDRADILSTQVQLNGEDINATIAYNGLVYTVNADAPDTVALTGWTGTAPKGALTVPAQIVSGANTYKVTKIRTLGGGSRILSFPGRPLTR